MDVHRGPLLSLWFSFHLLTVSDCQVNTVRGFVGDTVVLPCRYDVAEHGQLHSCWGRGEVPSSGCYNEVITSDGVTVIWRKSQRYQLLQGLKNGDVSLTITGAQESDTGKYGCRVHIKGLFNDQKVNLNLVITQAPVQTEKAPELQTKATERTSKSTWTTFNHTHGPGGVTATESSEESIAQKTDEPQNVTLAVLIPVLLLLLALVIVFLIFMRKRWKKASEMLGMSQQPAPGVLYRNSESSLRLHSREMAVENIYQMDEDDDYYACP
ncbi:hepatitis A virus cellular receptor 1 [Conger conger]|uniref:hepatitis A virus cellular receptor 1 n=1 Tax=Conger conger TaxID=82655 RepID=UPI002A5A26FD|nr:hepatitis A virus cellular receptor 1 [Conger conger]